MTPHIYLVTLWREPDPYVENHCVTYYYHSTVYKIVKISSISTSYNNEILLLMDELLECLHCCTGTFT